MGKNCPSDVLPHTDPILIVLEYKPDIRFKKPVT
jgi:hypothetical protein